MKRPLLALTLACAITPAYADDPSHITQVNWSLTKRVTLIGVVDQPSTITFPPDESVYRVIPTTVDMPGGDPEAPWRMPAADEVKESPLGNNLPLWPKKPGVSTLTVITMSGDQRQKPYAFRLVARANDPGAADMPDVTYNLIFNSQDEIKKKAAEQAVFVRQTADARTAKDRLRVDAFYQPGPCQYEAQGKPYNPITPRCPVDNGQWTIMRFPGLSRKPAVYVVNEDNSERVAKQHGDGDFVVVEEIARKFRLRLYPHVLDIINNHYDPDGTPANTGTTSPDVIRDVIKAKAH